MNFGVLVDVCLGVLSVMILFTLAAAAINEMIADNILNMRGKSLHDAIVGLARMYVPFKPQSEKDDKKALKTEKKNHDDEIDKIMTAFYKEPSIQALMEDRSWLKWPIACWASAVKGDYRPPSAIEPAVFAAAFKTALGNGAGAPEEDKLAEDFTLTMDRVSGWYVRKVKTSLFIIGLFLAVGANVDLLRYADQLSKDANLQKRIDATVGMIDALQAPVSPGQPPADLGEAAKALTAQIKDLDGKIEKAGLTVGWACVAGEPNLIPSQIDDLYCPEGNLNGARPAQIIGWLVIAFGVTLGAQFWFDLFRTLVNLRTPGKTGGAVEDLSASNDVRGSSLAPAQR